MAAANVQAWTKTSDLRNEQQLPREASPRDALRATAVLLEVSYSRDGPARSSRRRFGGSDAVDLETRIDVWLETVPILLREVDVRHVTLFCHSAGAVYLLNTLDRHREILDPRAPTAILIAPWVPAAEAKTLYSNILSALPAGVIRAQHGAAKVVRAISPSLQWSSAISANLIDKSTPAVSGEGDGTSLEAERYGCDAATAKQISKLTSEYTWAEVTKAINDEALVCLHKMTPGAWGACEDYAEFVRKLVKREKELQPDHKLTVLAYFAESDELVGTGGQEYVEDCFSQRGVTAVIDFRSCVSPGTDHNSIVMNHMRGPLAQMFKHVGSVLKT